MTKTDGVVLILVVSHVLCTLGGAGIGALLALWRNE